MKTTAALACALLAAATVTASDAATVHVHKQHKTVTVTARQSSKQHHGHQQQLFKATPWDADVAVKNEKCGDLCYLSGFWAHQLGRNCISRPTELCTKFKLAKAGLDAVLMVAECECDSASSAEGSTDGKVVEGSKDEDEDEDDDSAEGNSSDSNATTAATRHH